MDANEHLKVLCEMRAVAGMLDDEEAAALDAAIAALARQVPADGEWVLVPRETLKRLADGIDNCLSNARAREDAYDVGYMGAMLKDAEAMLAATPQAPQPVVDASYMGMRIVEDKSLAPDEFSIRSQPQQGAVAWISPEEIALFDGGPKIAEAWATVTLSSGQGDGRTVPLYTTIGQQAVDEKLQEAIRNSAMDMEAAARQEEPMLRLQRVVLLTRAEELRKALTAALAAHGKPNG